MERPLSSSEYLVRIEIAPPADLDPDDLAVLREREAERAAELAAEGVLMRLWRVPGGWANRGLWRADDEETLRRALDSLPLRPFMSITIESLLEHPSDPGRDASRDL